jgi:hypothetical protein
VRRTFEVTESANATKASRRRVVYVAFLQLLTALFALRVAAQLVQYMAPVRFLPPFEAWQGSGVDYPVLLVSQLLILVGMVGGAVAVSRGMLPRRRIGLWLMVLGGVYFTSMCARLVLGFTILADVSWFAKPLPTLFHMVLAGYVLGLGHYHFRRDD